MLLGVTDFEPEVLVSDVQVAEHELAFDADQLKVALEPLFTEEGFAPRDTVGDGVFGCPGEVVVDTLPVRGKNAHFGEPLNLS